MRITRHDILETRSNGDPAPERTLVTIFLRGGADGLTLVPPIADDAYHSARPSLRVRAEDAIRLDDRFGLNPALAALMPHIEDGRLAIIHGAGSDDTTRSHFAAQDRMEHGGDQGGGWLGRYLRARAAPASAAPTNATPTSATSPSALSAVAIGTTRPESLRGAPGGAVIQTVRDFGLDADPNVMERLGRLYAKAAGPIGAAGRSTLEAVHTLRAMRGADYVPERGAVYPDTSFGRGLREIARLVKADVGMVATTIDMIGGGLSWDTHFVQGQGIPTLMRELADGIDAFWTDLSAHRQRVTVVVMTEFGRRVRENTSLGTDHGAGSVMFVLDDGLGTRTRPGSPIIGGAVHAGFDALEEGTLIGPGDVPVTTDYRDVIAEVLRWHAPGIDLNAVFPGR